MNEFKAGDIVCRGSNDIHQVLDDGYMDAHEFICLHDESGVYKVGEIELNMSNRYDLITDNAYPELYAIAKNNCWI